MVYIPSEGPGAWHPDTALVKTPLSKGRQGDGGGSATQVRLWGLPTFPAPHGMCVLCVLSRRKVMGWERAGGEGEVWSLEGKGEDLTFWTQNDTGWVQ